ncbi:MAG: c-type cytochrome [Planctomycetota bacterium]|jgi:mono/diheme cytochrome c family protein|nr:c-type cytochrome [Planctomycetota bacterium]
MSARLLVIASCLCVLSACGGPHADAWNAIPEARRDAAEASYVERCATCHGNTGRGNGPSAKGLNPQPTAFTTEWRDGTDPEWIDHVIHQGGRAMKISPSMPANKDLSPEQCSDLRLFLMTLP